MNDKRELLEHVSDVHTTKLGLMRIQRNLDIDVEDVVAWCKQKVLQKDACIHRKGKNWYIVVDAIKITINAYSYTIITAHKNEKDN